jgi:hypothetical protein
MDAWNTMKRARDLLTVASCFAAKGVNEDDSGRNIAEMFATLLDLIENEVDDAMIMCPRNEEAARAEANPADDCPAT